jgi:hypothetical protein
MLGKSRHKDFINTIFFKERLGLLGDDNAISAPRILNVRRTFVIVFMDVVGKGSGWNELVPSGNDHA